VTAPLGTILCPELRQRFSRPTEHPFGNRYYCLPRGGVSVDSLERAIRIIVAGKGGSGKSTTVALLARLAARRGLHVVVVDADESNPGIRRMLGVSEPGPSLMDMIGGRTHAFGTLKDASSEELQAAVKSVMEKTRSRNLSVVEVGKIREAGSGCACPHGVISREILSFPLESGTLMILDTEAGVEHFGRGVDALAEIMLFVIDPSYEALELCQEAKTLADQIGLEFRAILNKVEDKNTVAFMREQLARKSIMVEASIPYDDDLFQSALHGKALEVRTAADSIEKLLDSVLASNASSDCA
jgi:CO dehydrogenase maturation factor